MKIRLGLWCDPFCGTDPAEPVEAADPARIRELLRVAEAVEALGFDLLWIADRPERAAAGLHLAAALAVRARRMRIGAGPVLLPLAHPLRLAEDAATLDGIAGGRLELALDTGCDAPRSAELAAAGVPPAEAGDRFDEAVEVLRGAWGGAPLRLAGRFISVSDVDVVPKPEQPGGPPLWLRLRCDSDVRHAARAGAGAILPLSADPRPFLDAWQRASLPPATARIAFHLPGPPAAQPPRELRARVDRALEALPDIACTDLLLPGLLPDLSPDRVLRTAESAIRTLQGLSAGSR